jgi:hypothetical protein
VGGFSRGNAALVEEPQDRSLEGIVAKALHHAFIYGPFRDRYVHLISAGGYAAWAPRPPYR